MYPLRLEQSLIVCQPECEVDVSVAVGFVVSSKSFSSGLVRELWSADPPAEFWVSIRTEH